MTSYQRKALLAQEKRDDARAETRVRLGNHVSAYAGHTPVFANDAGEVNVTMRGGQGCGRMRVGRVERKRDGGLRFIGPASDPGAPRSGSGEPPTRSKPIGDRLVNDTQSSLVARPASMPRAE